MTVYISNKTLRSFYRLPTKLWEGDVFSRACPSVIMSIGGGGSLTVQGPAPSTGPQMSHTIIKLLVFMHFKEQQAGMDDDVADWSCTDVDRWLSQNGFQQYVDLLCYQHKIDGQVISFRQVVVYLVNVVNLLKNSKPMNCGLSSKFLKICNKGQIALQRR